MFHCHMTKIYNYISKIKDQRSLTDGRSHIDSVRLNRCRPRVGIALLEHVVPANAVRFLSGKEGLLIFPATVILGDKTPSVSCGERE